MEWLPPYLPDLGEHGALTTLFVSGDVPDMGVDAS
jgi:hypothetical protein